MANWFSILKWYSRANVPAMAAIAFILFCPAVASSETLQTYRTGIDLGNESSTGCDFSLGSVAPGTLPGFELQITVVVDTDLEPPQVVSAVMETCNGAEFANPRPLSDFALYRGTGELSSDSVEGVIPRSLLGDTMFVRLAHHTRSSEGSEDALFSIDGSADGTAIVVGFPTVVPALSPLGLGALAFLLLAVFLVKLRRGAMVLILVPLLVGSVAWIAYAAFNETLGTDDPADATPADRRAEIVASLAETTDSELRLRLDIAKIVMDGWFLKSVPAGKYVIADIHSGILSATAPNHDSGFTCFLLEYNSERSNFWLRSDASGKYFTVHSPDSIVFADGMDTSGAAGWVVYVISSDAPKYESRAYQYTVIIVADDEVTTGIQAMQFDFSTDNLRVVNYGSDLNALLNNPATNFALTIPSN